MKTLSKKLCTIVILASLFTSCKKQAGPKGDTGATGASGSTGIKPDQIFTFTTSTSSWNAVTWPYNYQETVLNISSITSAVVSGGDVRVYSGDGTGTSWTALPNSFFTTQYGYKVQSGQINILVTLDNGTLPPTPGVQYYKVVVLPPQ